MSVLGPVTSTGTVSEAAIQARVGRVPEAIIDAWREHGTGYLGDDGFVRLLDPDRAAEMLEIELPGDGTIVFSTGLGDIIAWSMDRWWFIEFRWGVIRISPVGAADRFLAALSMPSEQDRVLERQPYPEAVARAGMPGPEQCYGYVPLLALGGPPTADHLELGGMWEHIAIILRLAGSPQVGAELEV